MDLVSFKVGDHKFEVPARFTAGHVCTAEDAAKLNRAMAMALADLAKSELKANDDYDAVNAILHGAASEFAFASGKRKVPTDPVQVEARRIAASLLKARYREKGVDPNSVDKVVLAEQIESLIIRRPDLTIDEARLRIAAAQDAFKELPR